MKTVIAALVAMLSAASLLAAEAPAKAEAAAPAPVKAEAAVEKSSADWDFIGVGFFPKAPPSADIVDVYGLKFGIPVSFGDNAKVVGMEASMIASTTKRVKGLQCALIYCKADKVSGVQANPIVNDAKDVSGVQAGIVNIASGKSFQFGLVNYIEDSSVPFFPIVNFKF